MGRYERKEDNKKRMRRIRDSKIIWKCESEREDGENRRIGK